MRGRAVFTSFTSVFTSNFTDKNMDIGGSLLPSCVNPSNFPAKLWRLVNNPLNEAIFWDKYGQLVVIDQDLFERQVLCPSTVSSDSADAFKTTNFSSFVRQLNLYGFKKAEAADTGAGGHSLFHHFYNPNFKRDRPELVASMRRLTADYKAKVQAGVVVPRQPASRPPRYSSGDEGQDQKRKRGNSSLLSPKHQESTPRYHPNKAQVMTAYNGTPIPPQFPTRGLGAAFGPSVFATDKGMLASLSHRSTAEPSSPSAVHFQQSLLARPYHVNPNFTTYTGHQPGFCSPFCQSYHPSLLASPMARSGLQTGLFSPHSYYQASYPCNVMCHGDNNQDSKQHQDEKKCDINLDTVFQIADEVMQTLPSNSLVGAVTPVKPGAAIVPSSNTSSTMLRDSSANTVKVEPLRPWPIITAVVGNVDLMTYKQEEESVVSVPEQMPEDAINEATSDDATHTEDVYVEVCDTLRDTSQSRCTGRTPSL
ncbi:heat shock factor protein 5 [Epinephelus moara]|uniref:heat shock factor protein 5 n=1 Tax=Epinephelus moara TaxID=300413 RepID=UPI00214F3052|nr:heat shock factor protein 5 [Epinephelus moara]